MTKKELTTTYNTLHWLRDITINGDRYGWGYDLESINKIIAHIENEIKLKENTK